MTRKIIVLLLAMAIFAPVAAQKRKSAKKAKPKAQPVVVVEETPAERLFKTMLPATAKVMFIDSTVVDKSDFLSQIPLSKEAGTLSTFEAFFDRPSQVLLGVFRNEFGDRCYYADGDTLATALYSTDRLGNQWSKPRELTEFGRDYEMPNFPFLQTDGITLFFAAQGEHSLGGYDIFMTRYDTDEGRFYRPENYGLPFNSTANDYLIAFDEVNALGFLVSDRHQPADKVCIYVFVPTTPRQSFESEDLSESQLRHYAEISSIGDTWAFGDRQSALQRYEAMRSQKSTQQNTGDFRFVIDDATVYRRLSDFRSPQSRDLYRKYAALAASTDTDERTLSMQRDKFARAPMREKLQMREAMLRLEHQIDENRAQLQKIAKEIRYIEIKIKN